MTASPPEPTMRVVGIGASAGGLDALKQLLANLPVDTGMAFVILQHLAPSQTGVLRAALGGSTAMPVVDVVSGMRVRPDQIHLVPPQVDLVLLRGAFVLRPAKPGKRTHLPIDAMLHSLADVLAELAVGVVLSGTASDGSDGLRAMRAAGGVTFVQDPATAQFDEMPRSAIAAGGAGFVLGPAEIGVQLGKLAATSPAEPEVPTGVTQIIHILRERTGIDFSDYKRPTIERRITHRMLEVHHTSPESYAEYLLATPPEAMILSEDLLIHVTEFFREPAALDLLSAQAFPRIIEHLPPGDPIRVWVPGCSTGQEAYSLAILLIEFLETAGEQRRIQLFGTDLSERSIETARAGWYPDVISAQVNAARLERFFTRGEGGWQVSKTVRERCVFVRHDLTTDPPFSKLDLISCRNLLIYLGPPLQQGVIPMFHYALNQPGFLLLGRAESIAGFDGLFAPLHGGGPIFARQPTAGRSPLVFAMGRPGHTLKRAPNPRSRSAVDIQRDVDHVLLARYAPACVLIDAGGEIRQFRGRTGRFLEPAPGLPHHDVYKMARGGLGREIRTALARAQREDRAVRREDITVHEDGHSRRVHLEVVPVPGMATQDRQFIVVFEDAVEHPRTAPRRKRGTPTAAEQSETLRLEQELASTREYLHSALGQHASANEELGAANEELQSINEELLSMNEELQTAKEELQSTNEELETVNDELRSGNDRLAVLNDDLVNVLASIEIAIIIVDAEHKVRRYTPRALAIMNLIPGDIGRRITDLKPVIAIEDLGGALARVMASLVPYEAELRDASSGWYRMQIRPYRTAANKIDGAVISFVDIGLLRRSVEEARTTRDYAEAIVATVPSPLAVLDADRRIASANRAFFTTFRVAPEAAVGHTLLQVGAGTWRTGGAALETALATGGSFDDIVVEREEDGDVRVLQIGARVFAEGRPYDRLVLVGMLDITDRIRVEEERAVARRIVVDAAEAIAREKELFLNAVSHELRTPLNAILLWTNLLRRGEPDAERLQHAIETIELSARAEARLVDDLLDLAVLRSPPGLAVALAEVDPSPIVEAALDAVRADADAKQVVIELELDRTVRVRADPLRLQQIAWNLAANAIKFTPEGGRVNVRLSRQLGSVELGVKDSGRGIRAELLPRVFDAFWQADQSTTRNEQGLGIGLALVRQLVERQGGTIRVDSQGEGTGATFTVQLPCDPS